MSRCYAYVRVSTVRQGQQGVSLEAQRDAIIRYAARSGIEIAEWFEETQTAAKQGRPAFGRMMTALRRYRADGVVVHKIDRSARNLRDWADLAELADRGLEIHFAAESLDLSSRGGRLSADIQAVVAADYIRNLREEARKGFYGRLRQGLLPVRAPLGYVDNGGGKTKTLDPEKGQLVKELFERYATGRYSMRALTLTMKGRGLVNQAGKALDVNAVSRVLSNPFYKGIIQIKTTGEVFEGAHEPLVSSVLYDHAQDILSGRVGRLKKHRHVIALRQMLACAGCGNTLVPERQKGRVYYRCHEKACDVRCIREDRIDEALSRVFERLRLTDDVFAVLKDAVESLLAARVDIAKQDDQRHALALSAVTERLDRLTDLLIDGVIDKEAYERKRRRLLEEKLGLSEAARQGREDTERVSARVLQVLELSRDAAAVYREAGAMEKRSLVETLTSNRRVDEKNAFVELRFPFSALADELDVLDGGGYRDVPRTPSVLYPRPVSCSVSHERIISLLMKWSEQPDCATLRGFEKHEEQERTYSLRYH